jgi:methylated-DNA-[protein]-cysteine S-methyltransferase
VITFTLFDTPIGRCGVAWDDADRIVGVQLPEAAVADTRARLRDRFDAAGAGSPPVPVQRAIDEMGASLRGEPDALDTIALAMDGVPPFRRRVYEVTRTVPAGETMSYGELAAEVGAPGAARAVGQALGRNPFAIIVPCHRVIAANGKPGGFTAAGGVSIKLRMLAIEGVECG